MVYLQRTTEVRTGEYAVQADPTDFKAQKKQQERKGKNHRIDKMGERK